MLFFMIFGYLSNRDSNVLCNMSGQKRILQNIYVRVSVIYEVSLAQLFQN